MKRGEVWWVNFDPSLGGEIKKERPAVVVSIDPYNRVSNRVQVVPFTSNTAKLYPSEVLVHIGRIPSKAMIDQIFTADKQRFRKKITELNSTEMEQIAEVIKLHLGLL